MPKLPGGTRTFANVLDFRKAVRHNGPERSKSRHANTDSLGRGDSKRNGHASQKRGQMEGCLVDADAPRKVHSSLVPFLGNSLHFDRRSQQSQNEYAELQGKPISPPQGDGPGEEKVSCHAEVMVAEAMSNAAGAGLERTLQEDSTRTGKTSNTRDTGASPESRAPPLPRRARSLLSRAIAIPRVRAREKMTSRANEQTHVDAEGGMNLAAAAGNPDMRLTLKVESDIQSPARRSTQDCGCASKLPADDLSGSKNALHDAFRAIEAITPDSDSPSIHLDTDSLKGKAKQFANRFPGGAGNVGSGGGQRAVSNQHGNSSFTKGEIYPDVGPGNSLDVMPIHSSECAASAAGASETEESSQHLTPWGTDTSQVSSARNEPGSCNRFSLRGSSSKTGSANQRSVSERSTLFGILSKQNNALQMFDTDSESEMGSSDDFDGFLDCEVSSAPVRKVSIMNDPFIAYSTHAQHTAKMSAFEKMTARMQQRK